MNEWMLYVISFFEATFLAVVFTLLIMRFGRYVATPHRRTPYETPRKVTRFGGLAVLGAFTLALFIHPTLVLSPPLLGMLGGVGVLVVVGLIDDIKGLSPAWQLGGQVVASIVPIAAGMRLAAITSPFGGVIGLEEWHIAGIALPESIVLVGWLLVMMNAINWLDGTDGLAGSVGAIGAFALFGISVSLSVHQPPLGVIAMALAGALIGFLVFNFPPAKVFLGTTGSVGIGFVLGVLAVVAGSKLATAAVVFTWPLLDVIWVLWQRFWSKKPFTKADFSHLHYRLKRAHWRDRQILGVAVGASALLGAAAIFLPTLEKIIAGGIAACALLLFFGFLYPPTRKSGNLT